MLWFSATRLLGAPPLRIDEESQTGFWFSEPYGYVSQLGAEKEIDQAVVEQTLAAPFEALKAYGKKPYPGAKPYVLVDYSKATGYKTEARQWGVDWVLKNKTEFADFIVVVPPSHRMLAMAAQIITASMRVAGVKFGAEKSLFIAAHKWSPKAVHADLPQIRIPTRLLAP